MAREAGGRSSATTPGGGGGCFFFVLTMFIIIIIITIIILCGNAVLLMSCEACDMFLKRNLEKAFQSMYMRSWMLAVVQLVAFAAPFTYLKKLEGKELWSFRGKHSGPGKRVSCGQNTQLQSPVYKGYEPNAMSDSSSLMTQTCQSDLSEPKPTLEIVPYRGPIGPPTVLGPGGLESVASASGEGNPFWTEKAKDEFTLKAMRPASLPVLPDGDLLGGSPPAVASPPSGFGVQESLDDVRQDHMMRMVAEENSKLWQELSSMKA